MRTCRHCAKLEEDRRGGGGGGGGEGKMEGGVKRREQYQGCVRVCVCVDVENGRSCERPGDVGIIILLGHRLHKAMHNMDTVGPHCILKEGWSIEAVHGAQKSVHTVAVKRPKLDYGGKVLCSHHCILLANEVSQLFDCKRRKGGHNGQPVVLVTEQQKHLLRGILDKVVDESVVVAGPHVGSEAREHCALLHQGGL